MPHPSREEIDRLLDKCFEEDIGAGDITTRSIVGEHVVLSADVICKQDLIFCGAELFEAVFLRLDSTSKFIHYAKDGERFEKGQKLFQVTAKATALLEGERTALNLIQHLSGIATLTHEYVDKARPAVILDTRKTAPGLRVFQKYAVLCGGGTNHRIGLFDAILIKDNHIKAAGSIRQAVALVRAKMGPQFPVEVETVNLEEVREALDVKADTIMLDNMKLEEMRTALNLIGDRAKTEVSGNVDLKDLGDLSSLGVDYISVGRLTHSAPAVDISMNIIWKD
ncbi:MAG: nicotinate-nucleotide diphosphorylase (carboxylating) [Nitrospinae bacterium CG11_big_fil_rev_8_21_14_0_20_45_15]|nr:MAG: nicotinate-nucleotide diphosphorylase (carboxylating) [Nitrospinae bacterium CG11_big_fil_rev_8_21_14_0_20_45_15]